MKVTILCNFLGKPENFVIWVAPYRWPGLPKVKGQSRGKLLNEHSIASRSTASYFIFDTLGSQIKPTADVHKLWLGAPLGMSIFQTDREHRDWLHKLERIKISYK